MNKEPEAVSDSSKEIQELSIKLQQALNNIHYIELRLSELGTKPEKNILYSIPKENTISKLDMIRNKLQKMN
jgi:hypothetical protein